MTNHSLCEHPATKAGRAACRKGPAARPADVAIFADSYTVHLHYTYDPARVFECYKCGAPRQYRCKPTCVDSWL